MGTIDRNTDELSGLGSYRDRREAGRRLAGLLREYVGRKDLVVLALPRGGVPVGAEVAHALNAPLDIILVRKLGLPGQEEFAFGAIAQGGVRVLNDEIVESLGISTETIDLVAAREGAELERRLRLYRGTRPPLDLAGKTVILVDDGLATGATMRAALAALLSSKTRRPQRVVVAVPVGARETCEIFERIDPAVSCLCALIPDSFQAVGLWYDDFSPTGDEEVREALENSRLPVAK